MDKLIKYQKVLENFCEEYAETKYSRQTFEKHAIIDKKRNHFQVLVVGWHKKQFQCTILFHFDIKDEKVWIQNNSTEVLVGDELVKMGIPKSDIVLGFVPEYGRKSSGFAEA